MSLRRDGSRLCALALLVPLWAQAQPLPDAGQGLRELERPAPHLPPPAPLELNLPATAGAKAAEEAAGPSLFVRRFRITGSHAFSEEALRALLSDLEGRALRLGQLQAAAERLTAHYRAHGYLLARAYLPAQEVEDGVVEIAVLEGRYGAIHLNDRLGLGGFALAPLAALRPGQIAQAERLERSLLLLADTPGVEVKATLRPGAAVGTTDLAVEVLPAPRVSGALHLENHGNRYTGAWSLGGALNLSNPLRLGDALELRLLDSEKDRSYLRGAYHLPVGPWATRLGVAYAHLDYALGEEFADLNAAGRARVTSAYLRQPLLRSRALNLSITLQHDRKKLRDEIGLFDSRNDKRMRLWSVTLAGDGRDGVGGGGLTSFSLTWSEGELALDSPFERLQDRLTARTAGHFTRLNAALLRQQRLAGRFSLRTRVEAQWSTHNLDSSEKLVLGGPYGVRAYPQGEGTGDRGVLVNVDLNYALAGGWQAGAFADYGRVRLHARPWAGEEATARELSGAGLTLGWAGSGWRVEGSAAWRLKERPRQEPDRRPRLWVQVVRRF